MNYSLKYENDIGSVDFSVASGFVVEQATSYGGQNVDFDTTRSGGRCWAIALPPETR